MTTAIELSGVSKRYSIYESPADRLRELLTFQRGNYHQDFWALRNISFEVRRGEAFALIGENGSGKSTLLQLIAGILEPTEGLISLNGRVAALLELGAGFNPEFSGRDNVFLYAAVLGLSTPEIEKRYASIESFAGIGSFISQPVRTYSSGMAMRLCFSVAMHCDPDILLVDEALAVGDMAFRERCLQKIKGLRHRGVTILMVSHSAPDVTALCERAVWLERGTMRQIGPATRVMDDYLSAMAQKDQRYATKHNEEVDLEEDTAPSAVTGIPNIDYRSGDGSGQIRGVMLLNDKGRQTGYLAPGKPFTVRITALAVTSLEKPIVGFNIKNHLGIVFCGTDTDLEACPLAPMRPGDTVTADFRLISPELYPSSFSFSVFLQDSASGQRCTCDHLENSIAAPVVSTGKQVYGYFHIPCQIAIHRDGKGIGSPTGSKALEFA